MNALQLILWSLLSASTAALAQAPGAKGPSTLELLIMPAGFLLIMYFFMIRPQQKKAKEQQLLLTQLKAGDEVVTSSGVIGKIKSMNEQIVTLELGSHASMKILKSTIASLYNIQPDKTK